MMKRKVLNSINDFTYKIYESLRAVVDKEENMIFSPASIFAALSMTYAGARETTAAEMKRVMGIPDCADAEYHEAFSKIWDNIIRTNSNNLCCLEIANRLWLQQGYHVEHDFKDTLGKYYKAEPADVDFRENPEAARQKINAWVEEKTRKRITDVIEKGSPSPDTKLMITNALYFKGKWSSCFYSDETVKTKFHGDQDYEVDMMHQTSTFGYEKAEEYDCQVAVARYQNCSLRMLFVLPNKKEGLPELENLIAKNGLEDGILRQWVGANRRDVSLYLPRFQFSQQYNIVETLQGMGMNHLFSPSNANLTGISKDALYISNIAHKAFIEVNEEGTEAAAYTESDVKCAGIYRPPPEFKADHPFLFFLVDYDTYSVIVSGRFCKPCSK